MLNFKFTNRVPVYLFILILKNCELIYSHIITVPKFPTLAY